MKIDNFTGYVLAGGKSSRMGTDKAFLRIGDETFLSRAVKTLSSVCGNRVAIVLNNEQKHFIEKLPGKVPYIFDVYANRGALGGIHAALDNCPTEYAIVLAVDLPLMNCEAIGKLTEIALSSNEFTAVVPRQTDGRFQPLCAAYHVRRCLPPLERLMNENESAAVRDFLKIIAPRFIEQDKLTAGQSNDIFFNANFPADLKTLKAID